MATNSIEVTFNVHSERRRFCEQICDRLKTLFGVDIVIKSVSEIPCSITTQALDNKPGKHDRQCDVFETDSAVPKISKCANERGSKARSKSRPGCSEDSTAVIWLFQNGSQEDTESAKKFAAAHLTPTADYITSPHQLSNLQEFEMVKECSKQIQITTWAFLTFDQDQLEVTLHGSQNSVASARSKVVMILDQLRDDASTGDNDCAENNIRESKILEDPLLKAFSETETEDKSKLTGDETQYPVAPKTGLNSTFKQESSNMISSLKDVKHTKSSDIGEVGENFEIITNAVAGLPFESYSAKSENPHKHVLRQVSSTSSFSSSSCSEEGDAEERTIATHPRYSQQIEMALKLGYTENNVIKVLKKLGPDCQRNDLLSELISVGASPALDVSHTSTSNVDKGEENLNDNIKNGVSLKKSDPSTQSHSSDKISQLGHSDASNNNGRSPDASDGSNLREIIIDGSNVAMSHGKTIFSCKGIKIAVKWFRDRGHKEIKAFVPQWRKETSRPDAPISDQEILSELERDGIVVFTPSRRIQGKRMVCYDDRYILTLAVETDGIVVSNDVYRDLVNERPDFRKVVDQRLLMYTFVNDRFMPPEDPLGRLGPTLDNFLRKTPLEPSPKPQDCPYGKKCTYGNKCRFYHPERGFTPQKSITDTLKEQADLKMQERATKMTEIAERGRKPKQKLARTKSLVPDLLPTQEDVNCQGRKEKPKLAHSKSLVFPTKTPDYLNESRKKLEEAELSAVQEKISVDTDLPTSWFSHGHEAFPSDDQSVIHSHSPMAPSTPHRDNMKQIISPDSMPPTSSARNVGTKSPRASPSHLTVPKTEQQGEAYLSGHLLLAKKLSDEGNENNFFSTPSSTRTTSPVILGSKSPDQWQTGKDDVENHFQEMIENSPYSTGIQPDFLHPKYQQQGYFQQSAPYGALDKLPNLSIFESEKPWFSNNRDVSDSQYRRQSLDSDRDTKQTSSPTAFPYSPDSGHYTVSTDSVSNLFINHPDYPPPSNMQKYQSDPLSGVKQVPQTGNHSYVRRAYSSSTSNVQKQQDVFPQFGRQVDLTAAPHRNEHLTLRPQQSMPVQALHLQNQSGSLTRQNSLSDPQIHSVADVGDQRRPSSSNILSPNDTRMLNHTDSIPFQSKANQENPNQIQQHYQQRFFENQSSGQQYWKQQDLQSRNFQAPNNGMGFSPYAGNAFGGNSHPKISQQLPLSHQTPGYSPYSPNMGKPVLASSSQGVPNPSQPPAHHYSIQKNKYNMFSTPYGPPFTGSYFPQGHGQAFHPQSYPQPQCPPHNQGYVVNPEHRPPGQHSTFVQPVLSSPPPRPTISPKDAPILPSDQRYATYFHLSNLFPEQSVRKVMNINPNLMDVNEICRLVLAYNQEFAN